ncbi:MAG: CHAT domain-containing protein [Caldilineaceae bacterium]
MAVAATLTILKQGKHYSFQWQQNLEGLPPVTFQQSRRADPAVESRIDHAVTLLNELLAQRQQRAAQASAATASDPDPLQTLGRLLYQQLFPAPIQQAILQLPPGSTLTIATNASTVPWEVAHGESGYLGLTHAVSRRLLSTVFPQSRRRPPEAQWSALLIGNPTADLPETAAEIEQVAALIEAMPGAAAPRILMQRRATKTTILQELASGRYDLLHYAGHAQFVAGRPEASGLVLARHELLTALELQQSLAGQPFVFLNGCESALDEVMSPANVDQPAGAGATVHGLAAAFLLGGACGLVGTQWPINDSSSRDFAAAFYRAILQGERVDRAVQQARTHVQKNQPRDPLWAAFTLYAEPDQPLVLRSQRTKRPATVLTCDLRMLTARFATENGERLSQTIDLLHSHIAGQINRAGGHLLPVAGDQLLALFSPTPTAPNDAERALRTAQSLIQSWSATNATHFPASIGVSSGELHWSMLPTTTALPVLGEPVRVAGRLAQLAAPGEVLVDAAVHQLTRRLFAFLPVVGKATTASAPGRPTIFQLSSMEAHGRSSPLWVDTRTRFVGRTRELTELHELWRRCQPQGSQGKIQGQLVGIAGEAGIGKSRLIQAFADELADAQSAGVPPQWIQTHCIAAYQPGPYEVVLQLLKPLLGLDASPSERQLDHAAFSTALQQVPGLTAIQQTETVALLCELFDLPALPGQPLVHLDRQSRQRRLVNLSGTLLAAHRTGSPHPRD